MESYILRTTETDSQDVYRHPGDDDDYVGTIYREKGGKWWALPNVDEDDDDYDKKLFDDRQDAIVYLLRNH